MQRTRSWHKFAVASAWSCGMLVFPPTPTPHPLHPHTHSHPYKTVVSLFSLLFGIASVSIRISSPVFGHCVCSIRVSIHIFGHCRSFHTRCTPTRACTCTCTHLTHLAEVCCRYHRNFCHSYVRMTNFGVFVLSTLKRHRILCTLAQNGCSVNITEFLDAFYVYPPDHPLYRRSRVDLQVRGVESRKYTYYCFCVHTNICV